MSKESITIESKKIVYKDNDKRYPLELTKEEEQLCIELSDSECYNLILQNRSGTVGSQGVSGVDSSHGDSGQQAHPSPPATSDEPVEPYMDSENYKIAWDSINAGGAPSASENYAMEDTVGGIGTGYSSATDQIHSGYQQMEYISINCTSPVNIGSIPSVTGGTLSGNSPCTVVTDNEGGYSLSAKASTNPAFQSASDSFANYTPAGSAPDYNWSVATNAAEFGFSARGTDVVQFFKDNNSDTCNISGGSQTADKCWYPFSTSYLEIASGGPNHPSGVTTTVYFKAESKKYLYPGAYQATITVTGILN